MEFEHLTDYMVLVGPNGVGKTTILNAIVMLKEWAAPSGNSKGCPFFAINQQNSCAEIYAEFELANEELEFARRHGDELPDGERIPISIKLRRANNKGHGEVEVTQSSPLLSKLFKQFEPEKGIGVFEYFGPSRMSGGGISENVSFETNLRDFGKEDAHGRTANWTFHQMRHAIFQSRISDLAHLEKTGERRDTLSELTKAFDRVFSCGLGGRKFRGVEFEPYLRILVDLPGNQSIDIDKLSTGERDVLSILTALHIVGPRNSIILYDTPEAYLHGAMERAMTGELMRLSTQPNQIIVCTHSPEIIDLSPLQSVYRMDWPTGMNQVSQLSGYADKIEAMECMGVSVGVQLISSTILFLEGTNSSTDARVLRAFFPELQEIATIVPSTNSKHIENLGARMSELAEEATKYNRVFAIRDRDYMAASKRSDLQSRYPRLLILDRYHIENYLLDDELIMSVLKCQFPSQSWTKQSVNEALNVCASAIRDRNFGVWLAYQCNEIRLRFQIEGTNAVAGLIDSADRMKVQISEIADAKALRELLTERERFLTENWPAEIWRTELPGRDILAEFVHRHCPGISAKSLTSKLIDAASNCDFDARRALRASIAPVFD